MIAGLRQAEMPVASAQPGGALVVMAKRPAAGQTKTRLTPPLSPRQAADLYECFLRDTLELAAQVGGAHLALACTPAGTESYFESLAPGFEVFSQSGASLGERLDNALQRCLAQGHAAVVLMDSDSPTLSPAFPAAAFQALAAGSDVVIGPCDDGGYYLIGLKGPAPRLLRQVRMSTPQVTADTLALAAQDGLQVHLLPTWYDVDDAAGLQRLAAELADLPARVAAHTRRWLSEISRDRE